MSVNTQGSQMCGSKKIYKTLQPNQWRNQDFPDGGGAPTPKVGAPTYYFGHFFSKTAWNWKKLHWEGARVPRTPLDQPIQISGKLHDVLDFNKTHSYFWRKQKVCHDNILWFKYSLNIINKLATFFPKSDHRNNEYSCLHTYIWSESHFEIFFKIRTDRFHQGNCVRKMWVRLVIEWMMELKQVDLRNFGCNATTTEIKCYSGRGIDFSSERWHISLHPPVSIICEVGTIFWFCLSKIEFKRIVFETKFLYMGVQVCVSKRLYCHAGLQGQQVPHQKWIWGIHGTQVMEHAS